jgi:hypothetical protein
MKTEKVIKEKLGELEKDLRKLQGKWFKNRRDVRFIEFLKINIC